jgi:hypothetical protein
MKLVLFWAALALPLLLAAQTPQGEDKPSYRVMLSIGRAWRPTGRLMELGDSTVLFARKPQLPQREWHEFSVREIQVMRFRRKGIGAEWALRGAAAGALSALLVGVVSKNDPPDAFLGFTRQQKGIIAGILFVPLGTVIGVAMADAKDKVFRIGGSATEYARQREKLERYRYGP